MVQSEMNSFKSPLNLNLGSRVKGHLKTPALLFTLLLLQSALNYQIGLHDLAWVEVPNQDGHLLDPELFKSLSFGNLGTFIDSLTLSILGDPSTHQVAPGTHPLSYYYLDAIVRLDPMYSEISPLANMLAVIRGDGLGARALLEKSQAFVKEHLSEYPEAFKKKYWPFPWQGQLFLAYVNIFELDDLPRASLAFRQAAQMPGSPPYLQRLLTKLSRPGGEYEVGLKLLEFMISGAKDEHYRSSLEEKLRNLRVRTFLYQINQEFLKFTFNKKLKTELLWIQFLKTQLKTVRDPWGGELYLNSQNKITTSTPNKKVFGLD